MPDDTPPASAMTIDLTAWAKGHRAALASDDFTVALPRDDWNRLVKDYPWLQLKPPGQGGVPPKAVDPPPADPATTPTPGSRAAVSKPLPRWDAVDEMASLVFGAKAKGVECRINACLCDRGTWVSVRARRKEKPDRPATGRGAPTATPADLSPLEYCNPKELEDFAVPTPLIVRTIWDLIRQPNKPPGTKRATGELQGVVIFAGGTGSAKSVNAQALVLEYVNELAGEKKDPPHLVTYEDPIETWATYGRRGKRNPLGAANAERFGFNFTARERGKDVISLRRAIAAAKRQKPKCLYIGELRNRREWDDVLEFAGSGHLVVVTTHAGSVTEAIGRVFQAVKARTPAERGWVAGKMLGCVHLLRKRNALFPSLWVRNPKAVNDLVATGLSSLAPNDDYMFGRRQFLEKLVGFARAAGPGGRTRGEIAYRQAVARFLAAGSALEETALGLDLSDI